jgi:hypothetical protein
MGVKPHKQVQFYKGTARHAVSSSETDSKGVPIPTVMELEIQKMDGLAPIVSLIPSSVLVGCDEEVPGCAQNKIPNTRETANLSTVTMRDLFLEKIHLSLSPDIQKAIKDDCRKFRTNKYGRPAAYQKGRSTRRWATSTSRRSSCTRTSTTAGRRSARRASATTSS